MTTDEQKIEPFQEPTEVVVPTPKTPLEQKVDNPERSKFPTIMDILAMLGIFLLSSVVTILITTILGMGSTPDLTPEGKGLDIAIKSAILYSTSIILMLIYRHFRGGRGRIFQISSSGFNPTILLWGVILSFAIGVVIEPLIALLPTPDIAGALGSGTWTIISVVVMAPIFEEIMCRGIILESIKSRYGTWIAWIISSIFFAIIHGEPILVINAFFMGLVLGFVYIQSKSIFAPIILHAINNALAYIMMISGNGDTLLIDFIDNQTTYTIVYVVASSLCIISTIMIYKIMKQQHEEEKKIGTA